MVSRADKNRMTEFIANLLEESSMYNLLEKNHSHLLVSLKPDYDPASSKIYLLAHNEKRTVKEVKRIHLQNYAEGIFTSDVFYKDGENFMVRLGGSANYRDDKSLKRYDKPDLDAMINMRDLEKFVEAKSSHTLAYYQPKTEKLSESIRVYRLKPVTLDYSHITPDHRSYNFVENSTSLDYKIAEEIESMADSAMFKFDASRRLALLTKS